MTRRRRLLLLGLAAAVAAALCLLLLATGAEQSRPSAEHSAVAAPPAPTRARPNPLLTPGQTQLVPLPIEQRDPAPPRRVLRNAPLAPGELGVVPPLFDNADDRRRYKQYYIAEFTRRANNYMTRYPDRDYPSDEELAEFFDEFYDVAEPRGLAESTADARARRERFGDLWHEFFKKMGAPLKTISARGGDPMYGVPPEPPVEIPGTRRTDPEWTGELRTGSP